MAGPVVDQAAVEAAAEVEVAVGPLRVAEVVAVVVDRLRILQAAAEAVAEVVFSWVGRPAAVEAVVGRPVEVEVLRLHHHRHRHHHRVVRLVDGGWLFDEFPQLSFGRKGQVSPLGLVSVTTAQ
jgi:hypothetical protein